MPTIMPGQREYNESLEPGNAMTVTTVAGGTALVRRHGINGGQTKTNVAAASTVTFGPYNQHCRLSITAFAQPCVAVETTSDVQLANIVVSALAPSDSDGQPDGTIYVQTA